jgi:hypothetical protein
MVNCRDGKKLAQRKVRRIERFLQFGVSESLPETAEEAE